eukprot:gene17809-19586_t
MAEITPSGNGEQSGESCYSTDELKQRYKATASTVKQAADEIQSQQVVYVRSKQFRADHHRQSDHKVKTENEPDRDSSTEVLREEDSQNDTEATDNSKQMKSSSTPATNPHRYNIKASQQQHDHRQTVASEFNRSISNSMRGSYYALTRPEVHRHLYRHRQQLHRFTTSKREQLSLLQPKRSNNSNDWATKDEANTTMLTRYEGDSPHEFITGRREEDTVVQFGESTSGRHDINPLRITTAVVAHRCNVDRNSRVRRSMGDLFNESRGDYSQMRAGKGRIIENDDNTMAHKAAKSSTTNAQELSVTAELKQVTQNNEDRDDHDHHNKSHCFNRSVFRAGRKSSIPNKIYQSVTESESHCHRLHSNSSSGASPKSSSSFNHVEAGEIKNNVSNDCHLNGPPNVTLVTEEQSKYARYDAKVKMKSYNEHDSQWESHECGKHSPPNNSPTAEINRQEGGPIGRFDNRHHHNNDNHYYLHHQPRSDMTKYNNGKDHRQLIDTGNSGSFSDEEQRAKADFQFSSSDRAMKKEAYALSRRENRDDFNFTTARDRNIDLHRRKFLASHRGVDEEEWQYSKRPRIVQQHQDYGGGKYHRHQTGPIDRRCIGIPSKDELASFTEPPRNRYTECYLAKDCMEHHGCNNNNSSNNNNNNNNNYVVEMVPNALHSKEYSKEYQEKQLQRFSPDDLKRMAEARFMQQGYQRCCCPCCPCYRIFRPGGTRERSPTVSPRCHPHAPPQPPSPLSPRQYSAQEFRKSDQQEPKPESSRQMASMPGELQQSKLVAARNIPHLRRRRNRTVYTHDQIEELEEVFKTKHYLDVDEKASIAKRLSIRTENVEIWFKNRRAKWRKEMKAVKSNNDSEVAQFMESPENADCESKDADSFAEKDSPVTFARNATNAVIYQDMPQVKDTEHTHTDNN